MLMTLLAPSLVDIILPSGQPTSHGSAIGIHFLFPNLTQSRLTFHPFLHIQTVRENYFFLITGICYATDGKYSLSQISPWSLIDCSSGDGKKQDNLVGKAPAVLLCPLLSATTMRFCLRCRWCLGCSTFVRLFCKQWGCLTYRWQVRVQMPYLF